MSSPKLSREQKRNLSDPIWRLSNLYHVKDEQTGRAVKFRPKPEQMQIIEAVYLRKERKILIPKARQLGISTVIALVILDNILFNSGVQAAIVDQTQADATKKLRNKVVFAFEQLPEVLQEKFAIEKDNDHAFSIRGTTKEDATSEVQAGMNARGDTYQILHVSEWGSIAHEDPARSEEILTGALPAAKKGLVFIETTWKGGKNGDLWGITKRAMETPPEHRTSEDYTLYFFPWWGEAGYALEGDVTQITPDCLAYFEEVESAIGRPLSAGQRLWYFKVAWTKGLFRFREFPSTLDECFRSPIEGAIYADLIDRLRAQNSVTAFPIDGSALVHTFWDLGSPQNTCVWYAQFVGREIRVVDCDVTPRDVDAAPETIVERVSRMLRKGYNFGWHYLPHDAIQTERSGRTLQSELANAGLKNTRVVPRTVDKWIGINRVRQLMPTMALRLPACEHGIEALSNYHTRRETGSGLSQDIPVHDWSCHCADALRTLAEAEMAGMIEGGSATAIQSRKRNGVVRVLSGFRGDSSHTPFEPKARVLF